LSGELGNFFFSAAGQGWLVALLRAGRLATLARETRAWSRTARQPLHAAVRRHLLGPLEPPRLRQARRRLRGVPSLGEQWMAGTALRHEHAAALELPKLLPQIDETGRGDMRGSFLVGALAVGTGAPARLAHEALTGIERRDPTGNRGLIEAALRQPEWVRRRDGISRAVARNAAADRLPSTISGRRRRGEQLPDWLDLMTAARGELQEEVEAMAEHEPSRVLIDVERLRGLVADWPDRTERATGTVERDYRYALLRAALVSRYMRWFERPSGRDGAGVPGDRATRDVEVGHALRLG